MALSSLQKAGRVKVGVRCRPAFQDEIDFAKGDFISIVDTRAEALNDPSLGQLSLTLISGKQREFLYDYVFSSDATQDQVYNRIAQPVVADVLKGFNGTIFAYGQTGTGKTYTMGILEFISNEHAGIIPRAVAQIFHYNEYQQLNHPGNEITISMSFLQLYRETIQDLLAPANGATTTADDNLAIREDPQRGFYVEGLQEFVVRNYQESEALINLGLENRAIAPTLMNATSSRSHTVLTINIEQRITTDVQAAHGASSSATNGGPMTPSNASSRSSSNTTLVSLANASARKSAQYTKTLRSKLLMVDLAGSERVRRTVSKGARLSEAKSINQSLSALGNVIAALAESSVSHIPYRDSKLTRLLQDSLGGTARTALIATVGPAAVNYGETLSTLMFASRCMSVKTVPVQHAEVDYAELCAALQAKVNEMEGVTTERLLQQQEGYELTIRELRNQLELERSNAAQHQVAIAAHSRDAAKAAFNSELRILLEHVEKVRTTERAYQQQRQRGQGQGRTSSHSSELQALECWLNKPVGWTIAGPNSAAGASATQPSALRPVPVDAVQAQLLGYCFEIISQLSVELTNTLHRNSEREELSKVNLADEFTAQEKVEAQRLRERAAMNANDPRNRNKSTPDLKNGTSAESSSLNGSTQEVPKIGSHLAPMSQLDALRRVEGQYRSNNDPVTHQATPDPLSHAVDSAQQSLLKLSLTQPLGPPVAIEARPSLFNYSSVEEVASALTAMHAGIRENLSSIKALLARKDAHYQNVKEALTLQLMEKRKREEEVINWSYILKYLLGSATKLRKQVHHHQGRDRKSASSSAAATTTSVSTQDNANNAGPAAATPVLFANSGVPSNNSGGAPFNAAHTAVRLPFSQLGTGILTAPIVPTRVPSQTSAQPIVLSSTQLDNSQRQGLSTEYDDSHVGASGSRASSQRAERSRSVDRRRNDTTSNTEDVDSQEVLPPAGRSRSRSKDTLSSHQPSLSSQQAQHQRETSVQYQRPQPSLPLQQPPTYLPQYSSDPASPPYSNVDDSDLSVGSTILTRSTVQGGGPGGGQGYSQPQQQQQQFAPQSAVPQQNPQYSQQAYNSNSYALAPPSQQSSRSGAPRAPVQQMYPPPQQQQAQVFAEGPNSSRNRGSSREYEYPGFLTPQHGPPSNPAMSSNSAPQPYQQQPYQQPYQQAYQQPYQAPPSRGPNTGNTERSTSGTGRSVAPQPQPQAGFHPASQFAQEVVQDLGVDSAQQEAAMSVIDKVSQISDQQLALLDPDTRQQILQIRRELGLSGSSNSNSGSVKRTSSGRRSDNIPAISTQGVRNAQYYTTQNVPKRANSAPKQRISSASASLLSQQPGMYHNPASYGSASGGNHANILSQSQQLPLRSARDREREQPQQQQQQQRVEAFSPYANPAQNLSHQWDMSPLTTASSVRYPPSSAGSYGAPQYHSQQYQSQQQDGRYAQQQRNQGEQYEQDYDDNDDDNFSQLDML